MRWKRSLLFVGFVAVFVASGCSGPTPETRENRRQLDFLLTAITVKKPKLVEQCAGRIAARNADGKISPERYRELMDVIGKAKAGDWQVAERLAYDFREKHPFFQ